MKKPVVGLICALLIISITTLSWRANAATSVKIKKHIRSVANRPSAAKELLGKYVDNVYEAAHLEESGLAFNLFKKALTGFLNLKATDQLPQNSSVLTIIDYTKPSSEKRMWIVNVLSKALVLHTWVAHGHGSGKTMANRFSDKIDSHKSSLGFYLTDEVYYGKNGRSLRLDGLDPGFNKNARVREIVVHAADYVGPGEISELGYAGRSYGCPAVSPEVADEVIDTMKDKTVLFISGNNKRYKSKYLNENQAASFVKSDSSSGYPANL